jgi:SAM-dependent methyltransferase
MKVFDAYAKYYDLLYKDKDYTSEVEYIRRLMSRFSNNVKTILELGCGTGKHASLLAQRGYEVTGVDQSETMLEAARSRGEGLSVKFVNGDVRDVQLNTSFDVVLSLFHVVSYLINSNDLDSAFKNAAKHLNRGGIFIFDVWYLPAVLSFKPEVRIKRLEDDRSIITRIAEPCIHMEENVVDVNYEILIENKETHCLDRLKETHRMRYLSSPEIAYFAKNAGLEILHSEEWISGKKPGADTWGVCFVCRKNK